MTDVQNNPSNNPYDYLSEEEILSILNAKTEDEIPLDLTAKILNLKEIIDKRASLDRDIYAIENSEILKRYKEAIKQGQKPATLTNFWKPEAQADLAYRGENALSAGARTLGSAVGALAGLTPVGRIARMALAGIAAPELGDVSAALVDSLTGKSDKGFFDTYEDYRQENLFNLQAPTMEGAIESGLSSIAGIGGPSISKELARGLGGANKAKRILAQEAEALKSGDVSRVSGYLGGNFEGMSKTLRDGVTKVGQRAVELLNSPALANSKNIGQAIDDVVALRAKLALDRISEVAEVASKTGARISPLVDDVTASIANKTGAAIPSQMNLTRQVLDETIDEVSSIIKNLKDFNIGDKAISALEKLKNSVPVDEALNASVTIRGLRDSINNYAKTPMLKGNLATNAGRVSQMLDDIANSVDDAVKQSLDNAVRSSTGTARGISFDAKKYDEITDNIRTLYEIEKALKSTGKLQSKQTTNLLTKAQREGSEAGILDFAMSPIRGAVNAGARGIAQSVFGKSSLPAVDELINYGANRGLGLNIIRGIDDVGQLVSPASQAATSGAIASLVNPIDEALRMGLEPNIMDPQSSFSRESFPDPLTEGVDRDAFYANQINVPDSSNQKIIEGGQNEQKLSRNSTSAMEFLAGKDITELGLEENEYNEILGLSSGDVRDQRLAASLLMKAKPELFEPTEIPGYSSLVDGIIVDLKERAKAESILMSALEGDPLKRVKAIQALRREEPLPSYAYKYLGGQEKKELEDEFLSQQEGFRTKAYLDTAREPKITIGEGVNLSDMSVSKLREAGVREDIITKVSPYLGVSGSSAKELLRNNPLTLSEEDALELSKAIKKDIKEKINNAFYEETGVELKDLPAEARTVLISLGYNFGANLKTVLPKIWKLASAGRWDMVAKRLEDSNNWRKNPELRERRIREASLLRKMIGKDSEFTELDRDIDVDKKIRLADNTKRLSYSF